MHIYRVTEIFTIRADWLKNLSFIILIKNKKIETFNIYL